MAFAPGTGAQKYAEDIAQIIADILHLLPIDGVGEFKCQGRTIEAADDPEYQGTHAMRITIRGTPKRSGQSARVPIPVSALSEGMMALTCSDAQADIFYTLQPSGTVLDDSCPSRAGAGNPASVKYVEPFAVETGDTIRFAAYRSGYINSVVRRHVITA